MESGDLCSEDQVEPAVCCCFCKFPLPLLCAEHLYKHPTGTELLQHFYLPVITRRWVSSQEIKDRCAPWLFQLNSAHHAFRRNDNEFFLCEEQLEAARVEIVAQVNNQIETQFAVLKAKLEALRLAFDAELLAAIEETSAHALEDWRPEAGSLVERIWNYDVGSSHTAKLVRCWGGVGEWNLSRAFRLGIDIQLPCLTHFSEEGAEGGEENVEKLNLQLDFYRKELEEMKKAIEAAETKNATLAQENHRLNLNFLRVSAELDSLKMQCNEQFTPFEEQLSLLKADNCTLAATRESEQEALRAEKEAQTQLFYEEMRGVVGRFEDQIKHLNEEKERIQSEWGADSQRISESLQILTREKSKEINSLKERLAISQLDGASHEVFLVPQLVRNTFKLLNVRTNEAYSVVLPKSFSAGSVCCLLDPNTILCVGGQPSITSSFLLTIPQNSLVEQHALEVPRKFPGIVRYRGFVYVFGGDTGEMITPASEKFEIASKSWTRLRDMARPRFCFSPCVYNYEIYLAEVSQSEGIIESFSIAKERFKTLRIQLPPQLGDGHFSVSFVVDGELVVITSKRQIGWVRLGKESQVKVAELSMKCVTSALSNAPPARMGRNVFWTNYQTGELVKFNLDSLNLVD